MELGFEKMQLPYLRQVLCQTKELELTQEVKLSEQLQDVGNILGAWGQVLIRSKEWRSNSLGISGGVLCWAMYMPEEGQPQTVEGWLPFQMQLDLPETTDDGQICVDPALKLVDARVTGAGKLMLRACVNLQVKAAVPAVAQVYTPPQAEPDIQLLQKTVSLQLPCEAGEKAFTMDEEFSLEGEPAEKLLYFCLQPVITEKKVMSGKLVFRGSALIHGLYQAEFGPKSFSMDIPFAQYVQLDMDYEPEAEAWICPAVTGLEMELTGENRVLMKAGLVGQYGIFEKKQLPVVEDAYSTQRQLNMETQLLELPNLVKVQTQTVFADFALQTEGIFVDAAFYPDHPKLQRSPDGAQVELRGRYQLLHRDNSGMLQGKSGKWEQNVPLGADEVAPANMRLYAAAPVQAESAELSWDSMALEEMQLPMVTALQLSEKKETGEERPSLILRRKGEESLWAIAKATGSTVEKIMEANGLEADPPADKMLLIPT